MDGFAPERVEPKSFPVDPGVGRLLDYFRAMKEKRFIKIGEDKEIGGAVLAAAVLRGVKTGQIEFFWARTGDGGLVDQKVELSDFGGQRRVGVTLDGDLIKKIEFEAKRYIPGGRMPSVDDKKPYVLKALKSAGDMGAKIGGIESLTKIMIEVYKLYREI